jgi:ATP-dependent DNA helicase RecQ
LRSWAFDHERVESVTALRRAEQAQMREYAETPTCRMHLLRRSLDDETATPCGLCDNCRHDPPEPQPSVAMVQAAVEYLRGAERTIEARKQWPDRRAIAADHRVETGRALSIWADGGWGSLVRSGRMDDGRFDHQLIVAAAAVITRTWQPQPAPTWVTFVPSRLHPDPVADLARRLAAELGLPCEEMVANGRPRTSQHELHNSMQQWANVRHAFVVRASVPPGPVLLVDDTVGSRWTLTVVGASLRAAGAGPVFPFVLADTAGRAPV